MVYGIQLPFHLAGTCLFWAVSSKTRHCPFPCSEMSGFHIWLLIFFSLIENKVHVLYK
jgi:hypothetical protein